MTVGFTKRQARPSAKQNGSHVNKVVFGMKKMVQGSNIWNMPHWAFSVIIVLLNGTPIAILQWHPELRNRYK
jgi:hypothetical protein